jgi:hypothetical protein
MGTRVMCSMPPTSYDVGKVLGDFHVADMNAGHGRAALLVDELGWNGFGQVGQKNGVAPAVAPLFGHTGCASNQKIIDFFGLNACSFDHFGKQLGQKLIRAHFAEPVPGWIVGSRAGLSCSQITGNDDVSHDFTSIGLVDLFIELTKFILCKTFPPFPPFP